jgi:hypothetical protein
MPVKACNGAALPYRVHLCCKFVVKMFWKRKNFAQMTVKPCSSVTFKTNAGVLFVSFKTGSMLECTLYSGHRNWCDTGQKYTTVVFSVVSPKGVTVRFPVMTENFNFFSASKSALGTT